MPQREDVHARQEPAPLQLGPHRHPLRLLRSLAPSLRPPPLLPLPRPLPLRPKVLRLPLQVHLPSLLRNGSHSRQGEVPPAHPQGPQVRERLLRGSAQRRQDERGDRSHGGGEGRQDRELRRGEHRLQIFTVFVSLSLFLAFSLSPRFSFLLLLCFFNCQHPPSSPLPLFRRPPT